MKLEAQLSVKIRLWKEKCIYSAIKNREKMFIRFVLSYSEKIIIVFVVRAFLFYTTKMGLKLQVVL